MGFFSDIRTTLENNANPANWSAGGSTAAQQTGRTLTDLGAPKNFGKNATSALSHPLSFGTGGIFGGKGGTFEVPHISGGSTTNALSGTDQYGNSGNKNRAIAAVIGAAVGGEALLGGGSGGTATGTGMTETALPSAAGTGGGGTAGAAVGEGTYAGDTLGAGVGPGAGASGAAGTGVGTTTTGMTLGQEVGLGVMGANAINGILNKPKPINTDPNAVGTSAGTTSNALLANFNKGQLQPQDQYNIAKWQQDRLQQSTDYYAKAGLADSSMAQEAAAGITAQGEAMRGQALTNMLNNGLAAAGVASNYSSQQVQLQIQQDQQLQQSQSQFMNTLSQYMMMAG
jgi:hypothetical protein